ncbi:MAG: alpha/beta fold hydrolase, partial [Pseudomonadota bacterium]
MATIEVVRDGVRLHAEVTGPENGPTVVFANSLGSTLHLWDPILPHLPDGLRIVRFDLRGHGKSDVPDGPYAMGQLISDAEAVCDAANLRDALFVGISVGGMIAQGLAVKRPDLIRALVLSSTAAKIGAPKMWQDRIAAVEAGGMAGIADNVIQRWFGNDFSATPARAQWLEMLQAAPAEGYMGVCAAIARTDF